MQTYGQGGCHRERKVYRDRIGCRDGKDAIETKVRGTERQHGCGDRRVAESGGPRSQEQRCQDNRLVEKARLARQDSCSDRRDTQRQEGCPREGRDPTQRGGMATLKHSFITPSVAL